MTLTLRRTNETGATNKGSALTHEELDANFVHLKNSANLDFLQSGTGAVVRTVQDKESDFVNVFDFMSDTQKADVRAGTALVDVASAVQLAADSGAPEVIFSHKNYRFESGIVLNNGATLFRGLGGTAGGTGTAGANAPQIIKAFSGGNLFTFSSVDTLYKNSGGGVENLRLVQGYGSGITAGGEGTAILITSAVAAKRPSWVHIRDVSIEYGASSDSWTWGIVFDGSTGDTPVLLPDMWMSGVTTHTASSSGGALKVKCASLKAINCAFYDAAANVSVTGTAGVTSQSVRFTDVDISGTLAIDYASDVSVFGGLVTTITTSANMSGTCVFIPLKLTNTFTDGSTRSGGGLRYNASSLTNASAGYWDFNKPVVFPNNAGGAVVKNGAGTGVLRLLYADSSNNQYIGLDANDVLYVKPLVALGGGAAPTLGTIGGSGPATAAQNSWLRILDSNGLACWIPVWK